MPKERRVRSRSFECKSHASPYSSTPQKQPSSPSRSVLDSLASSARDLREWEEARCPVCMEHPHNAVLLQCSSRDNGCRSFMCDTSYRHSNCLDQFCKAFSGAEAHLDGDHDAQKPSKFLCPLCRGQVTGWEVVEAARIFMNAKSRSCSLETCSFSGTYGELRKHARKEHPCVRPTVADPDRERDWRRMEQQRDLGDLMSSLQSTIGGSRSRAGHDGSVEHADDRSSFSLNPVAFYFVIRFRLPASRTDEPSAGTRTQTRSSRRRRRRGSNLWGEYSGQESVSRTSVSEGNENGGVDDGDGLLAEASDSSERGSGRSRRLLRMSDDEEDIL